MALAIQWAQVKRVVIVYDPDVEYASATDHLCPGCLHRWHTKPVDKPQTCPKCGEWPTMVDADRDKRGSMS